MQTLQFPAPATKTVTIQVAPQDLAMLRQSGYRLCVAMQVDGDYDVVWKSASQYLTSNQFQWVPWFQIFATNRFFDGASVQSLTNVVEIGLGEQSTLDQNGLLSPAMTMGPWQSVNLLNEYGLINPALNRLCTWIDGTKVATPIYVRQQQAKVGTTAMTPVDKVLVWFEQNIQAGTMFSTARSQAVEIDLTVANAATRLYQEGAWTQAE